MRTSYLQRNFTLLKETDDKLREDARKHEMTVSEYLRWLIAEQHRRDKKESE
jgi:hypothetical protein